MPFDEHNYEYVRDNSFAQKRALVADSRFKIIQKRQTKKPFDKPIVYLLIGATLFFLFIQMGIITPMTLYPWNGDSYYLLPYRYTSSELMSGYYIM